MMSSYHHAIMSTHLAYHLYFTTGNSHSGHMRLIVDMLVYVCRIFEQAILAAGMSFKSDKLWDMYLLWEKDNKNLRNITKIYDRLLATPTQLYSHHFEQ